MESPPSLPMLTFHSNYPNNHASRDTFVIQSAKRKRSKLSLKVAESSKIIQIRKNGQNWEKKSKLNENSLCMVKMVKHG